MAIGVLAIASLPKCLMAQALPFAGGAEPIGMDGWQGFLDQLFLLHLLVSLFLAVALAATIAYHPRTYTKIGSLQAAEAPRVLLTYSVVGAVIGTMVLKYGYVVGFVIFGIGGLLRFRTAVGSAKETGRVILVTLIGLSAGLNLPHVAIVSTLFFWLLIYTLEGRRAYRIVVKGLTRENLPEAEDAYRDLLTAKGCRILSGKKSYVKQTVALVFRATRGLERDDLEDLFEEEIPDRFRTAVDWESG